MIVADHILPCAKLVNHKAHTRTTARLSRVAIHRLSFAASSEPLKCPDDELNAERIAAAFADTTRYAPGYYTKGTIPYTFIIRPNGMIEQLLPVTAVASHALRWNVPALGVALIGDFRDRAPTEIQRVAAVEFCTLWRATGLIPYGHDELPGARSDTNKACPGAFLVMRNFRSAVYQRFKQEGWAKNSARDALEKLGVIF